MRKAARLLALACVALPWTAAFGEPPPRVIFVLIDALRADHLHYMGYPRETSPWLDDLAKHAVDFRFAIAPSDGTQRSVPAYMTGTYFSRLFREPVDSDGVPAQAVTLAELFREAGYRTLGWTTNPHVSRRNQCDQGFDVFRELFPHGVIYARVEHVIRDVRKHYAPSGQREFIYVHLMDVHSPYFAPSPYHRMWAPPYAGTQFSEGFMRGTDGKTAISLLPYWAENHDVQIDDVAYMVSQYDGEIRYLSEYLPLLFEALSYAPGQDLVLIAADHGEQFYEHGFLAHNKTTLIEELHVPLLVRHQAFKPRAVHTPVSLIDLWPTFCDILGADLPEGLPGRSLLPALKGQELPERALYAEGSDGRGPTGVVLEDDLLYYFNARVHAYLYPWRVWPIQELLFDLRNDPQCTLDLAAARPDLAQRMNASLRELNPRFESCEHDRLGGLPRQVAFGPDLLAEADGKDGVELSPQQRALRYEVAVEHPAKAHRLQFQYTLAPGGRLRVELQDAASERVFYYYNALKPRTRPRALTAMVYPPARETVLYVHYKGEGHAKWVGAALQRAPIPEPTMAPAQGAAEPIGGQDELSADEKARLEALGYLQ